MFQWTEIYQFIQSKDSLVSGFKKTGCVRIQVNIQVYNQALVGAIKPSELNRIETVT